MTLQGRNGPILGGDGGIEKIAVLSVSHEIVSPRDAASGLPTGKRMHKPFVITKQWDASTPVLLQACSSNEILPKVELNLAAAGSAVANMRMTLLDASCSDISESSGGNGQELETIAFTFRRIEVEHIVSKKMYVDDWTTSN